MNNNDKPSLEYQHNYSQLAHTYNYLSEPLLKMLPPITNAGDGEKIRVLDLGCGNGSFTNLLDGLGYDVVGVEESPSGIAIAQQSYPHCKFIKASIYDRVIA
jgi:trans-aconitate methyltransferase